MKKDIPLMSLYITLPVVIAMVLFGGFLSGNQLSIIGFLKEFFISFILATIILTLMPFDALVSAIKNFTGISPNSFIFGVIMNTVINIVLVFFVGLAMNIYNMTILRGIPLSEAFKALGKSYLPTFIVSYIVSFIGFNVYRKRL